MTRSSKADQVSGVRALMSYVVASVAWVMSRG
jgi:hypothetical protein